MADLKQFAIVTAAQEAREMVVTSPWDGTETDIVLNVLGYDSEPVQQASRKFTAREMAKRKKGNMEEVLLRKRIALATAAVVGGRGLELGGKEIAIPSDEFKAILADPEYVWLPAQIERFGDDRGNFSPEVQSD